MTAAAIRDLANYILQNIDSVIVSEQPNGWLILKRDAWAIQADEDQRGSDTDE